eukprot:gene15275-20579_t
MSTADEDYVYDEASGDWMPASELAARTKAENAIVVRDSVGNILKDGDAVALVKDLDVKGAGQTLRRGTIIRSIRLTGDAQEIDCKHDTIRGLVLRAEFGARNRRSSPTKAYLWKKWAETARSVAMRELFFKPAVNAQFRFQPSYKTARKYFVNHVSQCQIQNSILDCPGVQNECDLLNASENQVWMRARNAQ